MNEDSKEEYNQFEPHGLKANLPEQTKTNQNIESNQAIIISNNQKNYLTLLLN